MCIRDSTYIQEFQGYISPGILAAFIFGILVKKAPPMAGVVALLACVPIYGFLQWQFGEIAFLNSCLLYTSDAADERSSVDLGGHRIIKKKK